MEQTPNQHDNQLAQVENTSAELVQPPPAESQLALMQDRSNMIQMSKRDCSPAIAYTDAANHLRVYITKFIPTFRLQDQVKADKLKELFLDVSASVGECRDRQTKASGNLKLSAVFARNMKDKYNQHCDTKDSSMVWTEFHTKVDRDSIEDVMKLAKELIE